MNRLQLLYCLILSEVKMENEGNEENEILVITVLVILKIYKLLKLLLSATTKDNQNISTWPVDETFSGGFNNYVHIIE